MTCPGPDPDLCTVDGCPWTRQSGSPYCPGHRARVRRTGSVGMKPVIPKRPSGFVCIADGCEEPGRAARGLCDKHYARLQRHGKLEGRTTLDRLMEKVVVDPTTGCWAWQGSRDTGGYGTLALNGRQGGKARAHRVAYELLVGPIPDGLQIDHLCHTHDRTCSGGRGCLHRRCVNPEHLEPVEPAENTRRGFRWRATSCPTSPAADGCTNDAPCPSCPVALDLGADACPAVQSSCETRDVS